MCVFFFYYDLEMWELQPGFTPHPTSTPLGVGMFLYTLLLYTGDLLVGILVFTFVGSV